MARKRTTPTLRLAFIASTLIGSACAADGEGDPDAPRDAGGVDAGGADASPRDGGVVDTGIVEPPPHADRFEQAVAELEALLPMHRVPGAAIAVVQDGRLAFRRGLGVRRLREEEPVEATDGFRAGLFDYSNQGFALAALVLQNVAGVPSSSTSPRTCSAPPA